VLLCLDVVSIENLSATCSYFDQLISSKFLTSVNLPFTLSLINEVVSTNCLEKKSLLKLSSKKTRDDFKIFPDMPGEYSDPSSQHKLIMDMVNMPAMMDYLVLSQMSLLSLHSLLLFKIRLGSLSCVTRLDVLVDENMYLEQFMTQLPNLLELGLNILTKLFLSKHVLINQYLPRLEAVVAASKAPILKVTVLSETLHMVNKVFKNSFVEKLVVKGDCNFNMFPVMKKLKEVVVQLDCCLPGQFHWEDFHLHRTGLCCVNIGSIYENCPNVERFMGVEVGSVSQKQPFAEGNKEIKKRFHVDYLHKGGTKEMQDWDKTRWFSRRPVLPKD